MKQNSYKAYQTSEISEPLFETLTQTAFQGWSARGEYIPEPSKVSFEKVCDIVSKKLGIRENLIELKSNFVDTFSADSLDLVELIMAFEDAFEIEIKDEEAEKIKTVEDAINLLHRLVD
jgi:acyl carrier protein